jgi:hypothetical protein
MKQQVKAGLEELMTAESTIKEPYPRVRAVAAQD